MKSLSLLVRIDQIPEFQVGRGNIHIEGCSQHLLASNTVTVPTVTHSHSLPPGVSLRIREYGGRKEKRMLDEQQLCARIALRSVLKAVHLSRQIFYSATPQGHTPWRKEQKGDLRGDYMAQTCHF